MNHAHFVSRALASLEIEALTAMQLVSLSTIQKEPYTVLLAPTGSGKTLAFLLPIWHLLDHGKSGVQCLIISPTRELAIQIERVWQKMATGFKVNACYGGHSMETETDNLSQPPAVLVGTPGRLVEHLARGNFSAKKVRFLILDEYDKSLTLGFQEQLVEIFSHLKHLEKRVLVSATSKVSQPKFAGIGPPKVLGFTKADAVETDGLEILAVRASSLDKTEALFRLLCHIGPVPTLIFCNQREAVEQTNAALNERGIRSAFFHGGMEQIDREKALVRFRNGSTTFLVTTDLAARGLDIPSVRYVIHFEVSEKNTDFTHRNGRTARMNAEGTAFILLGKHEPMPVYLPEKPEFFILPETHELPAHSPWTTVYISGGKKDKLSKTDLVGFFSKKGGLEKDDIGLIELMDHMSFVAVKKTAMAGLMKAIFLEKIKGKKYKINEAW